MTFGKMTIAAIAAGLMVCAGCQHQAAEAPSASNQPNDLTVTPVAAPSTPSPSYAAPAANPQPVTYDNTTVTPTANAGSSAGGPISGGQYVIKRGDTLYSIARRAYGDGKQWQRIVQANPGLSPQSLRVGQTITLP